MTGTITLKVAIRPELDLLAAFQVEEALQDRREMLRTKLARIFAHKLEQGRTAVSDEERNASLAIIACDRALAAIRRELDGAEAFPDETPGRWFES